ncbi:MAG: tetratricopeptide repeat protein [Lachnospiraceae bacterium]|nr:tetratricopeptide repeat protein [Lachnospiraceae bacterium]
MSDKKEDMQQKDNMTGGNEKKAGYVIAVIFATVLGMIVGAGGTLFVTRNVWGGKQAVTQVAKQEDDSEETGQENALAEDGGEPAAAGIEEEISEIMNLAEICMEAGEYENALAYYENVLALDAAFAEAYRKLAEIYMILGNDTEAVGILNEGIGKSRESDAEMLRDQLVSELMSLAETCFETGAYEDALAYYGNVLTTEIDFAEAYQKLAEIYMILENYAEAVRVLSEGIGESQEADAEMLREQLVEVYLREADAWLAAGDYEQALIALREGVETTGAERLSDREQDVRGRVKPVKESAYNSDGSFLGWEEYEYDANGNEIKGVSYDSDGSLLRWYECEYDANGNLIKGSVYDSDGSLLRWYECEYDANGNRIKQSYYNSDGRLLWWYECEYDANGNLIKRVGYAGSFGWYEYEYDAIGNQIKGTTHYASPSSFLGWEEYEYDANGNEIKGVSYDSDGSLLWWHEYEYDVNGNEIKEASYEGSGILISWGEYEYAYIGEYAEPETLALTEKEIDVLVHIGRVLRSSVRGTLYAWQIKEEIENSLYNDTFFCITEDYGGEDRGDYRYWYFDVDTLNEICDSLNIVYDFTRVYRENYWNEWMDFIGSGAYYEEGQLVIYCYDAVPPQSFQLDEIYKEDGYWKLRLVSIGGGEQPNSYYSIWLRSVNNELGYEIDRYTFDYER